MKATAIAAEAALPNGFDNIAVDVEAIYQRFPLGHRHAPRPVWDSPFQRLYANPLLPLGTRRGAWTALHRTHLDQTWFERFRLYWAGILGGRPLWGPEDFYFLRNLWRMRFQSVHLPETNDPGMHLSAWQRSEVLHHLFHSVYKESLFHCVDLVRHLRLLPQRPCTVLEFGCGSAPLTTTLFEFFRSARDFHIVLADIQTIPFHFAAWKFAGFSNVRALPLLPAERFRLSLHEPLDAIFCMGVFEHLDNPLETAIHLHSLLKPGGLLVFDYVLTGGGGLDTPQGVRERGAVLQFVEKHFRVEHGALVATASIGPTVSRRL